MVKPFSFNVELLLPHVTELDVEVVLLGVDVEARVVVAANAGARGEHHGLVAGHDNLNLRSNIRLLHNLFPPFLYLMITFFPFLT